MENRLAILLSTGAGTSHRIGDITRSHNPSTGGADAEGLRNVSFIVPGRDMFGSRENHWWSDFIDATAKHAGRHLHDRCSS
jgi:hypothetical protein